MLTHSPLVQGLVEELAARYVEFPKVAIRALADEGLASAASQEGVLKSDLSCVRDYSVAFQGHP